jgi:ATP-dependent helicase/nuclease subunit A
MKLVNKLQSGFVVTDQDERNQALDPSLSYIIQAPAGSGKTELLTQRFLVLLARVRYAPEEVVAITFTRKAATEMRARIFDALCSAANNPAPESLHALKTWQFAKMALERDKKENWNLLKNPNRLRVTTIDSLCARITKCAPLLSQFGTIPAIIENAEPLYVEAANLLLESLHEETPWQNQLISLLLHLDNNFMTAEKLFVGMLGRRDQWLNFIIKHRYEDVRKILEQSLKNIITETLCKTEKLFPKEEQLESLELFNFASSQKNRTILHTFPKPIVENLPVWQDFSTLLLTQLYEWRRSINKNCGFPVKKDTSSHEQQQLFTNMKQRMISLLQRLSKLEHLRIALKEVLLLPPPCYHDQQWEIVAALIGLLPILAAYLNVIFREKNSIDFIAVTQGAIHALEEHDNVTDIKLNLDCQIQHLLVDEFQDTSATQYRLLELLTSGWEEHDGRTLFLVGDPMQSIYRFREADVGIFIKVKNQGLGNISLFPLTLKVNFRSQPGIVNWCNAAFKEIFPSHEDAELGAIPLSSSMPFLTEVKREQAVKLHSFIDPGEEDEANYVTELVKLELERDPNQSIAILVRSRNHLRNIIPKLKKARIDFNAIEIEKLIFSPVVQDLLALTKALVHTGDKIAWLSVLRAPWCGLSLNDLYLIANHNKSSTLFETLKNYQVINGLSTEAKIRLERITPILITAIQERSRGTIRAWIAYIWYSLGGPASVQEVHDMDNANAFFDLLDSCGNTLNNLEHIENILVDSYSHSASSNARVHLMTIHKSKGLEFDVVIIPSLEKKPAIDENRLLLWLEKQNRQGQSDLLLAPIRSYEEDYDPIYRYIRNQEALKLQFEMARLLYVAATRAKSKLHLLGSVATYKEQINTPISGSFLSLLWSSINEEFLIEKKNAPVDKSFFSNTLPLIRLALDWQLPNIIPPMEQRVAVFSKNKLEWSNPYLSQIGTLIHEILQIMSTQGLNVLPKIRDNLPKKLAAAGVVASYQEKCLVIIDKAIKQTLKSERGQWLLSDKHVDAKSEFSINVLSGNEVVHYVIDRTFVDEHNIRWIVDYKTSEISDDEAFLVSAKNRHKEQLENYGRAMRLIDDRKIKLALFFPLFAGWCEWEME